MSVESVCASKRLSASESVSGRKRAGESGSYDPLRAFTVISRVHSTATVARTVPSLGASYCTRIFVSRASAFARLHAAANAPESAVGRKRAAPACGRKRLLRPAPRLHGNLPRPLDRHGRAHRALARRIVLHANLRLPRIGFRAATQSASVRAKTTSTTLTVISRIHSTATVARTVSSLGASRESSSPARRPSRGYTLPPMRPNPPSEGSAPRQRAGENDFYDPPRAFTVISRVHSTATVARTVPSLGASYCTRIFVSRASAFARLRKVPACGQKRLLRPSR